jgi:hypothetical protein
MKSKRFFSDQIILKLQNDYPNQDLKISEREVFTRIDAIVNHMAAGNFLANWKLSGAGIDEGFITTWEPVLVTDLPNGKSSYLTFPSNWAGLPKNRGIDEVYPLKYNTTDQPAVVILSHSDYRLYQNNPASSMQGRLYGYVRGMDLIFGTCDVGKKYGKEFGVRLVVKDSSQIAINEIYPIPSDTEGDVVDAVVKWFVEKRLQTTDEVRDNKDSGIMKVKSKYERE